MNALIGYAQAALVATFDRHDTLRISCVAAVTLGLSPVRGVSMRRSSFAEARVVTSSSLWLGAPGDKTVGCSGSWHHYTVIWWVVMSARSALGASCAAGIWVMSRVFTAAVSKLTYGSVCYT
jgi:hypothetical protein